MEPENRGRKRGGMHGIDREKGGSRGTKSRNREGIEERREILRDSQGEREQRTREDAMYKAKDVI